MKRWIAALLTVAMLMSCFPLNVLAESGGPQAVGYSAAAEEAQAQKAAPEMDVETGGMTVEATNSFGKLLLDSMDETNGTAEAGLYDEGNKITGLSVEGTTAWVDFCTTADGADLVVAIYTEDKLEMLASGTVEVAAGETSVTVALEGTMPDYFMAKAYLLAKEDHAPLCKEYSTTLYTEVMVDLVSSTIYDYDPDRVLNLDDDETTNFLVVSRNTVLAKEEDGENIVVLNDADTMHYVIENADERIRNLKPGKMLVCTYGEGTMLIAKVAEIQADGTTVTITGENAEISDIFEQIKIQASGTTGDFTVDTSTCSEDLVYEGIVEQEALETENSIASDAYDFLFGDGIGETFTQTETYKYSFKAQHTTEKETDDTTSKSDVTVSGYIQLKLGAQFAYLLSLKQQYVTLTAASDLDGNINVTGTYDKSHQIGDFYYSPVWGVYIGMKPQVAIHAKAEIDYTFHANVTVGMAYDSKEGFVDLSKEPVFTSKLTMKGMIEVDLDLHPYAQVAIRLSDEEDKILEIADINMTTMVGLIIEAEMTGKNFEEFNTGDTSGGSGHECNSCLKAELSYRIKVAIELSLLKDLNIDWLTFKPTIADFTNKISDYYYSFDFKDSGFTTCPHISEAGAGNTGGGTSGGNGSGEIDDNIIASGTCGAEGDNITWTLDTEGVLTISGSGKFEYWYDYGYASSLAPWYVKRDNILSVIIEDGVTDIGNYAFYNCGNLKSVEIPASVTSIGWNAFKGCGWLMSINIPASVTSIGGNAFKFCRCLDSVEIPESVTWIGEGAFSNSGLLSVKIPSSITTIEKFVFDGCYNLASVEIPSSVTMIDSWAFSRCVNLISIYIPSSVTSIGEGAFEECSNLTNIKIPESVTNIENRTFGECNSLTSIELPTNISRIGDAAFHKCRNLTNIEIPTEVTEIGESAFCECSRLTSISIPVSVTEIGRYAFNKCSELSDIYYNGTQEQWKEINIRSYNIPLTSATIHYNSTGTDDATNGIFTGSQEEEPDGWQATFENLIPSMEYAVIVSLDESSPLAAENLQYITQEAANTDGTLTVYYRQSDTNVASYVVACGFGKTDPTEPSTPGITPGDSDSGNGGDSGDKPSDPSTPSTPSTNPGSSVSSGGGSGDGGAAAALLLAGAGAVAAVVVARAVLPVEVSGVVTDETGAPLPGATVAFWQNGAVVQQTVTGETGGYSVKLKKGGYDLAVSYLDPATGTAFQQTVTITAPDKARTVALDLSALKVPAGQA